MNVVLRVAVQEDYEAVSALYAQLVRVHARALPQFFQPAQSPALTQKVFAEVLANEQAAFFVAEQQGTIIGMIHCYVRTTPAMAFVVPRRLVHIEDLVVSEQVHHQGVGQALTERVQHWAWEQGITEIELDVWEFNTAARGLYEKLGYQTTRRHMRKLL
jgi:diamine N-acetyltransferase